mmetsp:Transcript_53011/g.139913  ORF Transcript_53011/g.139913 Transcript_53011/m.139913 type:complete len:200 (+) Transcript_53011:68-667(+)
MPRLDTAANNASWGAPHRASVCVRPKTTAENQNSVSGSSGAPSSAMASPAKRAAVVASSRRPTSRAAAQGRPRMAAGQQRAPAVKRARFTPPMTSVWPQVTAKATVRWRISVLHTARSMCRKASSPSSSRPLFQRPRCGTSLLRAPMYASTKVIAPPAARRSKEQPARPGTPGRTAARAAAHSAVHTVSTTPTKVPSTQ